MKWNVDDVKCDKMIDRPVKSDSVTKLTKQQSIR